MLSVEPGESLVWLLLAVQLCDQHWHCFAACMIGQVRSIIVVMVVPLCRRCLVIDSHAGIQVSLCLLVSLL